MFPTQPEEGSNLMKKKAFLLLACAAVFGACADPVTPAAGRQAPSTAAHDQAAADSAAQRGGNMMGSGN